MFFNTSIIAETT